MKNETESSFPGLCTARCRYSFDVIRRQGNLSLFLHNTRSHETRDSLRHIYINSKQVVFLFVPNHPQRAPSSKEKHFIILFAILFPVL